ncbi:MAG: hypothetical protein HDR89_01110 [Bacteroides sp.]|nr:hypothetical protein [Bacteroides sp.]
MKKFLILAGAAAMMLGISACSGKGASPKTFGDSIAYYAGQAQGYGINQNIKSMPEDLQAKVDRDQFLAGLKSVLNVDTANTDYLSGVQMGMQMFGQIAQWEKAGIDFNRDLFFAEFSRAFKADSINEVENLDANQLLQTLMQQAQAKVMEERNKEMMAQQKIKDEQFEANRLAGAKFVQEKLAADKEMKKTASGLVYKVNKMGTGAVAKMGDRVKCVYTGKLIDGTEFDTSNGKEIPFSTKGVVPGFAEALTTLPAGTNVTLYIPEDLGYGRQGAGQIQPGSTLVFDLVIGEAEAAPEQPSAAPAPSANPAAKVQVKPAK